MPRLEVSTSTRKYQGVMSFLRLTHALTQKNKILIINNHKGCKVLLPLYQLLNQSGLQKCIFCCLKNFEGGGVQPKWIWVSNIYGVPLQTMESCTGHSREDRGWSLAQMMITVQITCHRDHLQWSPPQFKGFGAFLFHMGFPMRNIFSACPVWLSIQFCAAFHTDLCMFRLRLLW